MTMRTLYLNTKIWNASRICVSSLLRGHGSRMTRKFVKRSNFLCLNTEFSLSSTFLTFSYIYIYIHIYIYIYIYIFIIILYLIYYIYILYYYIIIILYIILLYIYIICNHEVTHKLCNLQRQVFSILAST